MVSVRSEANVMVKNMIDVTLGGAAYWFVGYGFSFGPNSKASKTMSGEGDFITGRNWICFLFGDSSISPGLILGAYSRAKF